MATISVEVSEATKRWMDEDAADVGLGDASGLMREMILRRERERQEKIANMQRLVDEGRASGISARTVDEIVEDALRRAQEAGARP